MDEELKYDDVRFQLFNEELDEDGVISIGGVEFVRSRILFEMDVIAYEEAWIEFDEKRFEELKDTIYIEYPSCVSYNFRLSEKGEGASDPVRKLLHLKDTWESIVFVLYGIVWGEIRRKNIDLKVVQVFVSPGANGNPVYETFKTKRLITDALKTKIQNIKAIVEFSKANNLGLKCEQIEIALLDKLLELQDIRNDISHHIAPTKEEAEEELKQVIPLFKKMLVTTEFLKDCKLLRFEGYTSQCKCEEFNGHSLNKEFGDYNFDDNLASVLAFGQEQLFVKWDSEIFSVSPFLHFQSGNGGRESYLSVFKMKKEEKYWFEPVTKREEISFDHLQARFDAEQAVIVSLIVP